MKENEAIEFKEVITDGILKEVISFANTSGGTILIGVSDDGKRVGLPQPDADATRLTNSIRDAILPDITMFVQYVFEADGVLRVNVSEGTNKPYYLKKKGLKPSGVFVRQGTSSAQASVDQIRQMIKVSDGDSFEEIRSLNQSLTFDITASYFQQEELEFSTEKYPVLGITRNKELVYTNLAVLLSDQCPFTTKVAVFLDDSNIHFQDSTEFHGSLFKQVEDAYKYIMLNNRTSSAFEGLKRVDRLDYPEEAVREALLNAMIHRDYSFSGSIIININPKQMEFISIGGLPSGLTVDDIRSGISQPRNPKLAEVFHRVHLIESYGTGIRKIFILYRGSAIQPQILVTPNSFRIILPNLNALSTSTAELTPQMKEILSLIREKGPVSTEDLTNFLNVKRSRISSVTGTMRKLGVLTASGRGESRRYSIPVQLEKDENSASE